VAFPTTGVTLSRYDEVLKRFYLPGIQEQLNHDTILADMIEAGEKDTSGKEFTINCHYGRSGGTGARADGGALPSGDYQKYQTMTVPMKYNYGRVEFSGPTIRATRDEKGSYAQVIDNEITGITRDLKKEINRQLWGCGYGILGRWRSTESTTSYTIQRAYRANSAGGDGFGSAFGGKYLKENGKAVPVVLTAASSAITTATVDTTDMAVSAVTDGGANLYDTITCTNPAVTEADGTFYVRPANMVTYNASNNTGGARLEMMGLRGIVTDTDLDTIALDDDNNTSPAQDGLQGLVVATYTWWKSEVDSHASGRYANQRQLEYTLMQKVFDKVESNVGMGEGPNLILTTKAIRREYYEMCARDRRIVNNMTLDGGWKAIEFSGMPFTVDDDAIDGEIYFLTTKDLYIYRMSDYEWMQEDGAILSRVSGYDAYEAVLFRYAELGTTRRNSHGVLTDIYYEE
jgi:hypothetical protein